MWRELPSGLKAGWSWPSITSIGPDWVATRMVARGLPPIAGDDLGAAIVVDLEHAVGHQVEIAAALAPVDGVDLPPLDDGQADWAAILVIHAGVHGEGDVGRRGCRA